jgi:hypothetical protein
MKAALLWRGVMLLTLAATSTGCGGDDAATEAKPCDEECRDRSAVRSLREVIKVAYNLTLQGNDVGEQDETTRCPQGGNARVRGVATSVAEQGASELDLTYELNRCAYLQRDDEVDENYDITISGVVTEQGILAVQPTATTALIFESGSISVEGTVYDPPVDYAELDCAVHLAQNGNHFAGTWCGRKVGFDL